MEDRGGAGDGSEGGASWRAWIHGAWVVVQWVWWAFTRSLKLIQGLLLLVGVSANLAVSEQ